MSINSVLKKEGIEVVRELDNQKINTIAKSISSKLCLAFPEYNLNRNILFSTLCNLNMYIAKMPPDSSGAKYLYKNNSIYFNINLTLNEMISIAVHESIHFLQRINCKTKMGLYDFHNGLALNEAAVQLMASEANFCKTSSEKYFNISINTISPNYYPLECTIVMEMAYFTGTYPLYYSTLNGNDIFKNTFIEKAGEKCYYQIVKNLDSILSLENEIIYFISELMNTEKIKTIRLLNELINYRKERIKLLFFKTQNLIIKNCFSFEFESIRTAEMLKDFKKRLYDFKNIIGVSDGYTFYNDFYCSIMNALENKEELLNKYSEINLFKEFSNSFALVDTTKKSFDFVKKFATKLNKLLDLNKIKNNINEC